MLMKGLDTRFGEVLEQPDADGFFMVKNSRNDHEELACILYCHDSPSLNCGALQMVCA